MVKGELFKSEKGWGVKSTSFIKKGEIIELCPVVPLMKGQDQGHINQKQISRYSFKWNQECEVIVLGWGGVYNHSDSPNMIYFPKDGLMCYQAKEDIKNGVELTIDYGYHPVDYSWMETVMIFFQNKSKINWINKIIAK